jgi:hypothetical protein
VIVLNRVLLAGCSLAMGIAPYGMSRHARHGLPGEPGLLPIVPRIVPQSLAADHGASGESSQVELVGGTGIEPVTSFVSAKPGRKVAGA